MNAQHLRIRAAGKAVFDYDDTNDYGYDIDLELWLCDEMVNWNVLEPKVTVEQSLAIMMTDPEPFRIKLPLTFDLSAEVQNSATLTEDQLEFSKRSFI